LSQSDWTKPAEVKEEEEEEEEEDGDDDDDDALEVGELMHRQVGSCCYPGSRDFNLLSCQ